MPPGYGTVVSATEISQLGTVASLNRSIFQNEMKRPWVKREGFWVMHRHKWGSYTCDSLLTPEVKWVNSYYLRRSWNNTSITEMTVLIAEALYSFLILFFYSVCIIILSLARSIRRLDAILWGMLSDILMYPKNP
jgi:hypothetical protein